MKTARIPIKNSIFAERWQQCWKVTAWLLTFPIRRHHLVFCLDGRRSLLFLILGMIVSCLFAQFWALFLTPIFFFFFDIWAFLNRIFLKCAHCCTGRLNNSQHLWYHTWYLARINEYVLLLLLLLPRLVWVLLLRSTGAIRVHNYRTTAVAVAVKYMMRSTR